MPTATDHAHDTHAAGAGHAPPTGTAPDITRVVEEEGPADAAATTNRFWRNILIALVVVLAVGILAVAGIVAWGIISAKQQDRLGTAPQGAATTTTTTVDGAGAVANTPATVPTTPLAAARTSYVTDACPGMRKPFDNVGTTWVQLFDPAVAQCRIVYEVTSGILMFSSDGVHGYRATQTVQDMEELPHLVRAESGVLVGHYSLCPINTNLHEINWDCTPM